MDIVIEPGRYVVAVSGGVDSVALLHMLMQQPGLKLTVAHYDHGIRPESKDDRAHVAKIAKSLGLPFVYDEGNLGSASSETMARDARYKFLHKVREMTGSKAIITAHHQDDRLETAIINLLRGTGRRGISALKDTDVIKRPLLHLSKHDLLAHAHHHGLKWREDSTNADTKYFRNYVRHKILSGLDNQTRQQLADIINNAGELNDQIDAMLINHLHTQPGRDRLDRHWFIMLPHSVARETMAMWLRNHDIRGFDQKMIERLVNAAKTYNHSQKADIDGSHVLLIKNDDLILQTR